MDMLACTWRGFELSALTAKVKITRAIQAHHVLYQSGANLEDHGENVREITLRAVFIGDDYQSKLGEFLKLCSQPGQGELVHPVLGLRQAMLTSLQLENNLVEFTNGAYVDLQFWEDLPDRPVFTAGVGSEADAASAAASALPPLVLDACNLLGPACLMQIPMPQLGTAIGEMQTQVAGLDSGGSFLGAVVSGARNGVDIIRNAASIAQQVYKQALPIVSAIDPALGGRFARAGKRLSAWRKGADSASKLLGRLDSLTGSPASVPTRALAQALERVAAGSAGAQSAAAILSLEASRPTLTPRELGEIGDGAQAFLHGAQRGLDIMHDLAPFLPRQNSRALRDGLQHSRSTLARATRAAQNARPPLMTRPAPTAGTWLMQAHAWYGDASRAGELARLNPAIKPAAWIETGTQINGYAA